MWDLEDRVQLVQDSEGVKMAPNAIESDLEGFREEEDEDLKVFHKTKKNGKSAMVVSFVLIFKHSWVICILS